MTTPDLKEIEEIKGFTTSEIIIDGVKRANLVDGGYIDIHNGGELEVFSIKEYYVSSVDFNFDK